MEHIIEFIEKFDPEVAQGIDLELKRQRRNIELIASENFVSEAVLAAMGTVLTNKYAEGYPGKRYYGGCQCVDIVENLAIERAKELLSSTNELIVEVAARCGYKDVYYFSHSFKKYTGVPPKKYRDERG